MIRSSIAWNAIQTPKAYSQTSRLYAPRPPYTQASFSVPGPVMCQQSSYKVSSSPQEFPRARRQTPQIKLPDLKWPHNRGQGLAPRKLSQHLKALGQQSLFCKRWPTGKVKTKTNWNSQEANSYMCSWHLPQLVLTTVDFWKWLAAGRS